MSDQWKTELISAGNTFLATFLTVVAATLTSGIEWSTTFWVSLTIAAARAGIKAVIGRFVPIKLGGYKK